ncbi:Methionyl-tRNA formyltransferase [Aquiflexum balticum DSM 16537]|uniref:phosphoribosylglycinamide formyltransferase 1 n=1 Tax=Aquiflexum balticum DSM 16537 TaxID=758820 RepID=A0A1W2GYD4_9BACT|nr:formyl transferase [Aquiflexum balticum]SMD41720.1 Methionyl-tRNA formyltransferase [Aquiflexum balticum DSM 16537]
MKVVVISRCTPRESVVVNEIRKNFEDVVIIQIGASSGGNSAGNGVRDGVRENSSSWLNKNGKKFYSKIHKLFLIKELKKLNLYNLPEQRIDFPQNDLRKEKGIAFLKSLKPDIIFTCAAPILKESILTIPKIACINVHYGIPPEYRGNDTLFWALMNNDSNYIGACVHYINKGVDRGNVLAKAFPSLNRNESEVSIDLKTTILVAEAAVEVLKKIEKSEKKPIGLTQNELGRNYKQTERTFFLNLKYLVKKTLGKLKTEPRECSINYYLNE